MDEIRILALDGGGSRAGVLARTLGALYGPDTPGREIIRRFRFVAGTSGGAIVMTALCCNYTPRTVAGFYADPVVLERMFSPRWVARVPVLRQLLPRYSATGKRAALVRMFDENRQHGEPAPSSVPMTEWPRLLGTDVRLIVPAFDVDIERAHFFRSDPDSRAKSSARAIEATLADAVHASTNAPVLYFDRPAEVGGRRFWDGGIAGYSNPVLAAVIEALAAFPDRADRMRVLSIGTGASARVHASAAAPPPLGAPKGGPSLLAAVRKAAGAIVTAPPEAATFHACVALRQPLPSRPGEAAAGNIVRLSPFVRPIWDPDRGAWTLPNLSGAEFCAYTDMPLDAMDTRAIELIVTVCDRWMAGEIPNQPVRAGARLECDIGDPTFSAGAAHWRQIAGE